MMEILLALLGAGSAGGLSTIGVAANARLRKTLGSPIATTIVNFIVGFTVLTLLITLRVVPIPASVNLAAVPWWAFSGGVIGALFVSLNTLIVPRLGLTATTLAIVLSQMCMSLLIDSWGWLGVMPQPISRARMVAIVLLLIAIVLTQLDRKASGRSHPRQ
ncbi:DMT family transporter [Trichothermofontia sp.]